LEFVKNEKLEGSRERARFNGPAEKKKYRIAYQRELEKKGGWLLI